MGRKKGGRERVEDSKVPLTEKRIYKRLALGDFELYDTVEGPDTLDLGLAFHPTFLFQKKKTMTLWQLVNTVFRAKGQEVS